MDSHRIQSPLRIQPPPPPPSPSSDTSFPILAISILGILTTAILLLSYYIFVIKCGLNWRRSDVIGGLSRSRRRYSTTVEDRSLDESAIRAIPTFRFKMGGGDCAFHECSVCLNEFKGEERIRLLPNCFHVFHIDCIDTWLQTNANCPLCRSEITIPIPIPNDQFIAQYFHHSLDRDEDIVIEVTDDACDSSMRNREEQRIGQKGMKLQNLCSMGDECIDQRRKDEQFSVQPMRRSFSMDSSDYRQLHLAVQRILQQNPHFRELGGGECSSSRGGRGFFSFGHCRSSRSSVLPIQVEL